MKNFLKIAVSALLVIVLLAMTACGGEKKPQPTEEPAAPTAEPQADMQTILDSLGTMEWKEAKNVILFIGDGMGKNHIPAAVAATGGRYNGKLAIEYLPNYVDVNTLTADPGNGEPDSASGGTAMACGFKSLRKLLGLNTKKEVIKNVCELSKELGKSSGVVTSQTIYDATPSAFTAHVESRHDTDTIIGQQLTTAAADIIIGGGTALVEKYIADHADISGQMNETKTTYVKSWDDVKKFDGNGRLVATLTDTYWENIKEMTPTLADITKTSIELLSKNDKGFFLMVEAGAMDEATHNADMAELAYSMISFDEAVEEGIRYAYEHKDTLVIVTSDHNTGAILPRADADAHIEKNKATDIYISDEAWCVQNAELHCLLEAEKIAAQKHPEFDFENAAYRFTTIKHVNDNVPLYAVGFGAADNVTGKWSSFNIGQYIGKTLSGQDFGATTKTGQK